MNARRARAGIFLDGMKFPGGVASGGTVVTVRRSALDATPEERRTFDENHDSMRGGWTGTFEQRAEHLASLVRA